MKCKNCGIEITEDCKFCTNCGTPVEEVQNTTPSTQTVEDNRIEIQNAVNINTSVEDDKKANKLCIISLVLKYVPSIIIGGVYGASVDSSNSIANALTLLLGLGPLAALILMIYVRVKYPKNTFGKVLMWLYIIEIVFSLIALVIIMITCAGILNSCKGM